MLHGLVKYAWHRPCASKDNTTAAWQILDIERTMQIKYENMRILCRSETLNIYPSGIAIFTLAGWTFVSFDITNLTEVLKLGSQASYRSSSEHPKGDSERIEKKNNNLGFLFSCPVAACLPNHTQIRADNLP